MMVSPPAQGLEILTDYRCKWPPYCSSSVAGARVSGSPLAYMDAETWNRDALALWNAVICIDCEVISNTPGDECPACKNRSVVGLARMLGGSLLVHKVQRSYE